MNRDCLEIRQNILKASNVSGNGHIPTSFSIIECLYAVYSTIKNDPKNPQWAERDLFVLSKGHAALGQYAVMAQFGYFPVDDVNAFGAFESRFGCHPDRTKVPGIEVSTGSLGHGICVAAGMALGFKISRSPRRVVTLIGDGEANEGTVWEAVMVAADRKLDNLTIIVDFNKSQTRCLQIPNPAERFAAFGCDVTEVDGHDVEALKAALARPGNGKPHAIVAATVKGYGAATLETETFAWHRRSPKAEELTQLVGELDARQV
jgi:transketolase